MKILTPRKLPLIYTVTENLVVYSHNNNVEHTDVTKAHMGIEYIDSASKAHR